MAAKKRKKVKVHDLKPKKDAKGGIARQVSQGTNVGTNVG